MMPMLAFLLAILARFWKAYVISRTWLWFAVPVAAWVPSLAPLQVYGLMIVYDLVTLNLDAIESMKADPSRMIKVATHEVVAPTLYFGLAAGVRYFFS